MEYVVDAKPQLLYSRENKPEPTVDEGGWARGPVYTGLEYKQYLAPSGFQTPYRQACSYALPAGSIIQYDNYLYT